MKPLRQVLSELVVEQVGFGIFVLDRDLNVLMWNRFMADHSGKPAEQVIGKSIFVSFPELPRVWFTRKVESVFQLGSFSRSVRGSSGCICSSSTMTGRSLAASITCSRTAPSCRSRTSAR